MMDMKIEIPDAQPDSRTGMTTWTILGDGEPVGKIVEREDGYQASADDGEWYGPLRPFRQTAVADVLRHLNDDEVLVPTADDSYVVISVCLACADLRHHTCYGDGAADGEGQCECACQGEEVK